VSVALSTIEGNPQLEDLTLMLGALSGPGGARNASDVARALRTLPALTELSLVGLAGGFGASGATSGGGDGGSARLVLEVAQQLGRPGARPRLRRLNLVGWGGRGWGDDWECSLGDLVPRVRAVAPDLEVVIKREWMG